MPKIKLGTLASCLANFFLSGNYNYYDEMSKRNFGIKPKIVAA